MIAPRSVQLEALNERGDGVRVAFEWRGDRFGHTLFSVRRRVPLPMVMSAEGSPEQLWPPSPAYQELSEVEGADGGRSLVLTGMSGTTHWSVSVEPKIIQIPYSVKVPFNKLSEADTKLPDSVGSIQFDLAARLKEPPPNIAAAYDLMDRAIWSEPIGGKIAVECQSLPRLEIVEVDASDQTTFIIRPPTDPLNRRILQPCEATPKEFPCTYRWRYCVGCVTF